VDEKFEIIVQSLASNVLYSSKNTKKKCAQINHPYFVDLRHSLFLISRQDRGKLRVSLQKAGTKNSFKLLIAGMLSMKKEFCMHGNIDK